ncbi:hypothetical protein [Actinoplanes campanulatus]|uniref:hypothetical protein n=1 Tax=Actinoplanes campanulatus TaxID=113559 RepID=UPI001953B283|nr:hypothetical protein [Actinoplanes capillaceus]
MVASAAKRRNWGTWSLAAAAALLVGAIDGFVVATDPTGSGSAAGSGISGLPRTTSQGPTSIPPWDAPTDTAAAGRAAGLPMLGEEGAVAHFHAHLDVIVDGQPVTVPPGIGVDNTDHKISPLHTHENDAVIHVESPVKATFTPGQFLTEWQVSAGAGHLGGLQAGGNKLFRAYVNGKPADGYPSAIVLAEHQQIALVYGTAAQHANPPVTYPFPAGE